MAIIDEIENIVDNIVDRNNVIIFLSYHDMNQIVYDASQSSNMGWRVGMFPLTYKEVNIIFAHEIHNQDSRIEVFRRQSIYQRKNNLELVD